MKTILKAVCVVVIAYAGLHLLFASLGGGRALPLTEFEVAAVETTARTERVDSARFDAWLPNLREGADVTFSGKREDADEFVEPKAITSVSTLGPLPTAEIDMLVRHFDSISQVRFKGLHDLPASGEPGITYEVLREAELLCSAEEYRAAAEALRAGDYFVTPPGQRPPGPPDAGIVQTTARKDGKRCTVSVVMPFEKYKCFADAYRYRREIWLNYPAHAVTRWNQQSEKWRRQAMTRLAAARAERGGREQREWRKRWGPNGTVVDEETALMSLR
ncbi:MAG: hypothetical protein NXI31_19610 [bacterium]|nr:hypothetical protein [bacterium]